MTEIQKIDAGQSGWDKIFNENFLAIGNGNSTFTDTGRIADGVTLLNGTSVYSEFPGDEPSFRIIQMGTLNMMKICGAVKGITASKGTVNVNIATFPKQIADWLATHQTVNTHFFTSSLGIITSWVWRDSTLELQITSDEIQEDTWIGFNYVFIA
ncbi:hypothetical protein [Lactiplantibacillus plantarum]|uniref:hypothetical protein n=1 Tax=Lactiplantibacillus plantarum TaxID=1590 RepID=UPI003F536DDF